MGEAERQGGDAGRDGDVVEEVAIIGDQFTFLGRGRVVRTSATGDRRLKAPGVGAVVRRARKAGSRHEDLTVRVIEALMDKQFRRGEIEAALSGRCACPKRTLSDITKRIRERRNAKIVAEAVAKAKAAQRARAVEEEQARLLASIKQSWKTFG
jgi:hypothetical protein